MTQAAILCRANADQGSRWVSVVGGPDEWRIEAVYGTLEQAVERVKSHFAHDWTFTDRPFDDAIKTYAAGPDDLVKLGLNSHATILCPEGGGIVNRYATVHRVPLTAAFVAAGFDGKFRPQALGDRVAEWFARQHWRSFVPPKPIERREPVSQQTHRPAHTRELLVRHTWAAREIAPEAFAPLHLGPVVSAEQAARRISKMPQTKSAVRRAKHAANAERFRAEAEERARQREAAAQ